MESLTLTSLSQARRQLSLAHERIEQLESALDAARQDCQLYTEMACEFRRQRDDVTGRLRDLSTRLLAEALLDS